MGNPVSKSEIPQTCRVWPLRDPLEGERRTLADIRTRISRAFNEAGVDGETSASYSELIFSPSFLGASSPLHFDGKRADDACNYGQPAEVVTRNWQTGGLLFDLGRALGAPTPLRHLLALVELAYFSPLRALVLVEGRRDYLAEEVLDALIDAVNGLQAGSGFTEALQQLPNCGWLERHFDQAAFYDPSFNHLLSRLTRRRIVKPEAVVDFSLYQDGEDRDYPVFAPAQAFHGAAFNQRRLEFWFRHFNGRAFDVLFEAWLGFDDATLARVLRAAIKVDKLVATHKAQAGTDAAHLRECRAYGESLSMPEKASNLRRELPFALSAIEHLASVATPLSPGSSFGAQPAPLEFTKKLTADVERLQKSTDLNALESARATISGLLDLVAVRPATPPCATSQGVENLVAHLDERVRRGADRELKALYVHFGARLLAELRQLHGYERPWVQPVDLASVGVWGTVVLGRSDVAQRGPVEKRLGESAVHALTELRTLAQRAGDPEVDQRLTVIWPEVETQLTVAHQCGSLWHMLKQLMLAMRNLSERRIPCVAADLRYELADKKAPPPWTALANCMGLRLRATLDIEQGKDLLLKGLRQQWAEFLLERMLPPKEGAKQDRHKAPFETSAIFRLGHLKALKHLRINPEGKGHRIVNIVVEKDPDAAVRVEAAAVYKALRRADGEIQPEAARRSLFAAYFLFREAQVRAAGGEVAARASRTWYKEARDAKYDFRWFSERNRKQL